MMAKLVPDHNHHYPHGHQVIMSCLTCSTQSKPEVRVFRHEDSLGDTILADNNLLLCDGGHTSIRQHTLHHRQDYHPHHVYHQYLHLYNILSSKPKPS